VNVLDDPGFITKLDKSNVYGSVASLADQIQDTWQAFDSLPHPGECSTAANVVVAGMGGSALGGRVIKSLVFDRVRVPMEVVTDFHLPNYVNKNSLVVLSSYSGNTEETLNCAKEACDKDAKIFVIATGGKLAQFAKENNLPLYLLDPVHNPSGQPRMAVGYAIISVMALLAKCDFFHLTAEEVGETVSTVRKFASEFAVEVKEADNLAKRYALKLKNKILILVASGHLLGSAHVFKNQLNENAKTFSVLFDIPELNHHFMEGLRNPAEAKRFWHILFFESDVYSSEVVRRYPITQDVVAQNAVDYGIYKLRSTAKLDQIFELICFGSFTNFYLSMLYNLDPAPIPWVDYFKQKLGS